MNRRPWRKRRETIWNRSNHTNTTTGSRSEDDGEVVVDMVDQATKTQAIAVAKRRRRTSKRKPLPPRIGALFYWMCTLVVFFVGWGLYAWTTISNHSVSRKQLPPQIRRRQPPQQQQQPPSAQTLLSSSLSQNNTLTHYKYYSEQFVFQMLRKRIKARIQPNDRHPIRTEQNENRHGTNSKESSFHSSMGLWEESWLQRNHNEHTNCYVPWPNSTACDSTQYTILAVWSEQQQEHFGWNNATTHHQQQQQIRTIFLNCLRWLVDASVRSIHILMPSEAFDTIQTNEAYGQRILEWNRMERARVKIHFGTTFWDAWKQFYQNERITTMPRPLTTAAVVWIHANEPWPGNHLGIRHGWNLWKEHSAALVTTTAFWQVPRSFQSKNNYSTTVNIPFNLPQVQEKSFHRQSPAPNILVLPALVDLLSTTFHHGAYLCFLNHPALQILRDQTDWDTAWFGISMLLSLIVPSIHSESFEHVSTSETGSSSMQDIILFHPHSDGTVHLDKMEKIPTDLPLEPFRHVVSLFGGMPRMSDQSWDPKIFDEKVKLLLEESHRCLP